MIFSAAMDHRLFDLLEGGPKTAAEVCGENGASLRGVRALMNALVGFELLSKDAQERYALTPESATFLVRGKPGFLGGFMQHCDLTIPKWLHLPEVVQTGKPAMAVNQEGDGSEFFEAFVEDLFPVGYPAARALAAALPDKERSSRSRRRLRCLEHSAGAKFQSGAGDGGGLVGSFAGDASDDRAARRRGSI